MIFSAYALLGAHIGSAFLRQGSAHCRSNLKGNPDGEIGTQLSKITSLCKVCLCKNALINREHDILPPTAAE